MKTFALLVAAMPILSAFAAPTPGLETELHQLGKRYSNQLNKRSIESNVFKFTSTYEGAAFPDRVVNAMNVSTPGERNAKGSFLYGINSNEEIICYNITVFISGNYSSPARTATHIHQGVQQAAGPPRIAFPNPTITGPIDQFGRRQSIGCMTGPFTTGILANGTDTGTGFRLSQIEANPTGFFTDVHTVAFPAGAIRGQLRRTGRA